MSTTAKMPPTSGRRERKKMVTRATISREALRLFLERGYQAVSLRDVADAADVAVTTVFKHFTGKEALVFDEDKDLEQALLAAVAGRSPGTAILDALEEHMLQMRAVRAATDPEFEPFLTLVRSTPELDAYWRRMLLRHADALAEVIMEASANDTSAATALVIARTALDSVDIARRADDPGQAVRDSFTLLRTGWRGQD